jgi:hypothetical protein
LGATAPSSDLASQLSCAANAGMFVKMSIANNKTAIFGCMYYISIEIDISIIII